MAIIWNCNCGKTLKVSDDLAGRRVKCPECQEVTSAPDVAPAFEVVEETEEVPPMKREPKRVRAVVEDGSNKSRQRQLQDEEDEPAVKKKRDEVEEDETPTRKKRRDEDDDDQSWKKKRRDKSEEDDEDERPRKKQFKKGEKVDKSGHFHMERGVLNAGVLGGLAAMVGAIIWFVLGLVLLDRIFFYPPILFVLGVVAMFKGAMNNNER